MHGDAGPHIVVAPASVLDNWRRELAHWGPRLKVEVLFGAARAGARTKLEALRCDRLRTTSAWMSASTLSNPRFMSPLFVG